MMLYVVTCAAGCEPYWFTNKAAAERTAQEHPLHRFGVDHSTTLSGIECINFPTPDKYPLPVTHG
jgi:hypothetical protein